MSTATLYIRVSTDEQAVKGYSQRSQTDRLVKYCELNNITIHNTFFEDHSAKTFNRPAWTKLFEILKTRKTGVDLLLFTSWDRFSRNITDAYYMIQKLKRLGVAPQAIDQPIDLDIKESKITLAVYLAVSEVENDRRSESVRLGIRKAKQEGKWTGKAPLGYQNRQSRNGNKYIALYEPEASLLRNAFETIAGGEYSISYIYKQAVSTGLKCSKSNFCALLRNPVYCGKIAISEPETGKKYLVDGVHERLISPLLFGQVQEVLDRKRKKAPKKTVINEQLILRGFLVCPDCGKTLTGSASKGRSRKYYYYHCSSGCKFRKRADMVNRQFSDFLKTLRAREPFLELSEVLLKDIRQESHSKNLADRSRIDQKIAKLSDRMVNAHDLFTKGDIDYDDYMTIRSSCRDQIKDGVNELQQLAIDSVFTNNTQATVLNGIYEFYTKSDILSKRQFIRLIFPEKVILENDDFGTMVNRSMRIIFNLKTNSGGVSIYGTKPTPEAKEKYLKIISKVSVNNEIISPEVAFEAVFFLKRVIFTLIKGK
mgnify:CR=1 FL=1